jgi:hypothetical protein
MVDPGTVSVNFTLKSKQPEFSPAVFVMVAAPGEPALTCRIAHHFA